MPKVSVIIPIYGVEKYIERCARSLFDQTLYDIEYIFVNDCTKDNSINILLKVLDEYPHRKSQFKLLTHTENKGLPQARKTGIESASGDYIIHCDSDDWVDINAYKEMWQKAISNNYDIVFCDYFNSDGIIHTYKKEENISLNKKDITLSMIKNVSWTLWRSMIKHEIYNSDIIYPKSNNGEDFALMCQLLFYANSYAHIKKPLYYYFINPLSISNNPSIENFFNRIEQHKHNIKLLEDFYLKQKIIMKDEILLLKLIAKNRLYDLNKKEKYKKEWNQIFPEIENKFLFLNPKIPFYEKTKYYEFKYNLFSFFRFFRKIKNLFI